MASRSLPYFVLLLYKGIIVSAATAFHLYTDLTCKILYATVQTDTSAGNGQCGEFATSLNSASSVSVDDGCSVTTYTGLWCNNNATSVPTGDCTSMSIGSFSVDCPQINGTEAAYTTILVSGMSSQTSLSSTTSTSTSLVSVPTTSTSTSPVNVPLASTSQQHSTTSIRLSTPLSSTTSSSPGTPTSPLEGIRPSPFSTSQPSPLPSTSPSPSPSPSPSQKGGSGNDGGLSGPSTIAIGVVLPGVGVIVAIFFGVLGVKKWKNRPHGVPPDRRWSI